MATVSRTQLGVVGTGDVFEVGYWPQIELLRSRDLVDVTFLCDIRAEMAAVADERYGVDRFTTDYTELVESEEVDVVLVLTSMQSHAEICQRALEAGKHVLVEKPLATTLQEGLGLVELAQHSPGHLVPAPFVILSPTYQAIARHIRSGDIGKPLLARARYGWTGPSWGKWFYRRGGGAIFDLGVYNLTSLTGFLGPARRVSAMTGVAISQRVVDGEMIRVEAEDNAHILLDFGEAVFAVVSTGFTMQSYRSPAIEVYGSEGTVQMLGDDWNPNGYELWKNSVGAWLVYNERDPGWPWCDGLNHLVECIRTGETPLITPAHACHVLEIMLCAQEASRIGETVPLQTSFTPPLFPGPRDLRPAHLVNDPKYRPR